MLRWLLVALIIHVSSAAPVASQVEPPRPATPIVDEPSAGTPLAQGEIDLRGVAPLSLSGERRAAFAAFVTRALAACGGPGASVAVVQEGEVVFLQGFGVRELGGTEAVTPDTLMGAGSVTKPFTTALAAILVDAGLMRWDTPVIDLLPDFVLSDPALAPRLTIRDLFSAASGLPRRDFEFIFEADDYDPPTMIASLAEIPLTALPGERFQYSNQAFTVGGYALAAADGVSPDALWQGYARSLRDRLLNPLGMQRSTFALAEVIRAGNYAVPHARMLDGDPVAVPLQVDNRFTSAVAPAGGLWSSARDLARFLQMQLARGVAPDGTQLMSGANLERTWQPGVAVPPSSALPAIVNAGLAHYGLGWYVGEFGGLRLVSHSGGTYGFGSQIALLPDANLGIAVLANDVLCGALVGFAAQYRLFELVFDLPPAAEVEFDAFLATIDSQRREAMALLRAVDAAAVTPFLGGYTHPALGEITLFLDDGELWFDAGEVRSRLRPMPAIPGLPARYMMIDPPLNGTPAFFILGMRDALPRLALTLMGEHGDPPLVYSFTPLAG